MGDLRIERYNLTTKELAEKLGYHPQYVRILAASGRIPAFKRGRAWRFDGLEVFNHLQKLGMTNATDGSAEASKLLQ